MQAKDDKAEDFASVKLHKTFLRWLKIEAAKKSMPMYKFLEDLVADDNERPWLKDEIDDG